MAESEHLIFISYASPDRDRVLPIFDWLESEGFSVWFDARRLIPGQNWDFEIKRALDKATIFLVFISKLSYDRRGYLQRELKLALSKLEEKLIDAIYIIPVLLDDGVEVPPQLENIHYIKASDPIWKKQVLDSLQLQIDRLGLKRSEIQERQKVDWTSRSKIEVWEGLPGYEVEIQLLDFHSSEFPQVEDFGLYVRGQMFRNLFRERSVKLEMSKSCNFGQSKFARTNTFDATCGEPSIVGKIISIAYSINAYSAGAAHGNYGFDTYSFMMDPGFLIESAKEIFSDEEVALPVVQEIVRNQLLFKILHDEDAENAELIRKWINDGTESWDDYYAFVFREKEIEKLFGAYHVTCFADGPQSAKISYADIFQLIKEEYICALGLEYLRY